MIKQVTFHLSAKRRGCHLVTSEVLDRLNLGTWQGIYLCEFRDNLFDNFPKSTLVRTDTAKIFTTHCFNVITNSINFSLFSVNLLGLSINFSVNFPLFSGNFSVTFATVTFKIKSSVWNTGIV